MKTIVCVMLYLLGCASALANSNFVSNPYLPYPPGCARVPSAEELRTQAVKFFEDTVDLANVRSHEMVPVRMAAYRSPCSEPNRSLVWLELTLPATHAGEGVELELQVSVAEPETNWRHLMNLVAEPNGWGAGGWVDREQTYLASDEQPIAGEIWNVVGERRWLFLLDNGPPLSEGWFGDVGLTPSQYNASFKWWLRYPPYDYMSIDVPATADVLPTPTPRLPLSGRQSGTWVIEGADDQGFQLAISEQVGKRQDFAPAVPDLPLVMFFSQYTFDADGNPLWLVGNAEFEPGASEVTIPIVQVTNGEFRGSTPADREVIGSVTLSSNSCNDVTFEYDYTGLGLGQGSERLQRLFSLETAGYDCRDYEARVAANH